MGTQALSQSARGTLPRFGRTADRIFYGCMTLFMMGTIALGFRESYFPLGHRPAALHSPVIAVHGIVFTLYLLLFGAQVALIAAKRVKWHMSMGLAVYGLAVVMLPMGVLAAANEIKRDLATHTFYGGVDPYAFSIGPIMGMVLFGSLIVWSYAVRRQPQMHKRLALYATLAMMDAGIDRWPWASWGLDGHQSNWVFTTLVLLPVLFDLVTLRRVHRATAFAAPFVWVLNRLELPIGRTATWHVVGAWMLRHLA